MEMISIGVGFDRGLVLHDPDFIVENNMKKLIYDLL
jgi:hypothetical protein